MRHPLNKADFAATLVTLGVLWFLAFWYLSSLASLFVGILCTGIVLFCFRDHYKEAFSLVNKKLEESIKNQPDSSLKDEK